jgi:hypothetical protein
MRIGAVIMLAAVALCLGWLGGVYVVAGMRAEVAHTCVVN